MALLWLLLGTSIGTGISSIDFTGTVLNGVSIGSRSETTVAVFLSSRCPCSRSYEKMLSRLPERFPEVRFIGVVSNSHEGREELEGHFKKSPISFAILWDENQRLLKKFDAFRTPHAFIMGKDDRVVFRGPIGESHQANSSKSFPLIEALENVVAGQPVKDADVRTVGCIID